MNTFCTLFQKMSIATYKPTTVGADATGYVWFLCQIHIIVSYRKPRTYTAQFAPAGTWRLGFCAYEHNQIIFGTTVYIQCTGKQR